MGLYRVCQKEGLSCFVAWAVMVSLPAAWVVAAVAASRRVMACVRMDMAEV